MQYANGELDDGLSVRLHTPELTSVCELSQQGAQMLSRIIGRAGGVVGRVSLSFVAIAVCSCAQDADEAPEDRPNDDEREFIIAHVDYGSPDGRLEDWVSFADQLSVIEVLSERERGDRGEEAIASREGPVSRIITVEIGETVWWNSEVRDVPETGVIELGAMGWNLKDGKLTNLVGENAARLEVGGRYVVPLQWHGKNWSLLTSRCAFPADKDKVARADIERGGQTPLAEMLSRMTFSEIGDLLTSTPPYPVAAMHWDLPPSERLAAVLADEQQAEL